MKKTTRILAVILAIGMMFVFAACDGGTAKTTGKKTGENQSTTAPQSTEPTEEGHFEPVEGLDFGGEDFVILVPKSAAGDWAQFRDFTPTEMTEDVVDDANYERKQQMKELYNVNIVEKVGASGDIRGDVTNIWKSGDNEIDAAHVQLSLVGGLAQSGYFADLKSINSIDLTNPWYNQNAVRQLSIANRLFFIVGDISIVDNDGIAAMCFNKGLIADANLESPYTLIENNEWTIDKFHEMVSGYAYDSTGDGKMDNLDTWGYLAAYSSIIGQLTSCGVHFVEKDENDYPVLSLNTAKNVEILEAVFELYTDATGTFHVNQSTILPAGVSMWQYGNNMFMENRLLFRQTAMYRIVECRQMEEDFGIIPYPKYDADQENYAHTFSTATPCIAILSTAEDYERNGAVIEALSYYGRTIVRPAYYDTLLKGVVSRDEESGFCLDIIFDSADYDLGVVLDIGGLMSKFSSYVKEKKNTFASDYDSMSGIMEKTIQDYIDAYESILN